MKLALLILAVAVVGCDGNRQSSEYRRGFEAGVQAGALRTAAYDVETREWPRLSMTPGHWLHNPTVTLKFTGDFGRVELSSGMATVSICISDSTVRLPKSTVPCTIDKNTVYWIESPREAE